MKILAVDDSSRMRRTSERSLRDLGRNVSSRADDGASALLLLDEGKPEFVATARVERVDGARVPAA